MSEATALGVLVGLRLGGLALPVALGVLCARWGMFESPARAVRSLNVYALYVSFPALVAWGLLKPSSAPPAQWAFYALWPVALALWLVAVRLCARRDERGALAIGLSFGNVAYLGLPLLTALMGEALSGLTSWLVTVHVALAVTVGPLLGARWSSSLEGDVPAALTTPAVPRWRAALRSPLVWTPLLALLARQLPQGAQHGLTELIAPLAQSAAPVALFMLGIYLHEERAAFGRWSAPLSRLVALRLLGAPLLVWALGTGTLRMGWLTHEQLVVHVMLAAMPAAITTFSIAYDTRANPERTAAAIAWSTLLSIPSLAAWYVWVA